MFLEFLWIFDFIGYNGPFFIVCLVFLRLFLLKKFFHSIIFILGVFFKLFIDINLKGVFKDPRPTNPIDMVLPSWSWFFDGKLTTDKSLYQGNIKYGFPSGHAMGVLYGTSFLYFIQGGFSKFLGSNPENNFWLWLCLFISAITLVQRYKYRRHTIEQLIAGSLFGILLGWITYRFTRFLRKIFV